MDTSSSRIDAICSQLLTSKDLDITQELFNQVLEEEIVAKIEDSDKTKSIKIYSKKQLFLSLVTPILHDIGLMIVDEVTYTIQNENKTIFEY